MPSGRRRRAARRTRTRQEPRSANTPSRMRAAWRRHDRRANRSANRRGVDTREGRAEIRTPQRKSGTVGWLPQSSWQDCGRAAGRSGQPASPMVHHWWRPGQRHSRIRTKSGAGAGAMSITPYRQTEAGAAATTMLPLPMMVAATVAAAPKAPATHGRAIAGPSRPGPGRRRGVAHTEPVASTGSRAAVGSATLRECDYSAESLPTAAATANISR